MFLDLCKRNLHVSDISTANHQQVIREKGSNPSVSVLQLVPSFSSCDPCFDPQKNEVIYSSWGSLNMWKFDHEGRILKKIDSFTLRGDVYSCALGPKGSLYISFNRKGTQPLIRQISRGTSGRFTIDLTIDTSKIKNDVESLWKVFTYPSKDILILVATENSSFCHIFHKNKIFKAVCLPFHFALVPDIEIDWRWAMMFHGFEAQAENLPLYKFYSFDLNCLIDTSSHSLSPENYLFSIKSRNKTTLPCLAVTRIFNLKWRIVALSQEDENILVASIFELSAFSKETHSIPLTASIKFKCRPKNFAPTAILSVKDGFVLGHFEKNEVLVKLEENDPNVGKKTKKYFSK